MNSEQRQMKFMEDLSDFHREKWKEGHYLAVTVDLGTGNLVTATTVRDPKLTAAVVDQLPATMIRLLMKQCHLPLHMAVGAVRASVEEAEKDLLEETRMKQKLLEQVFDAEIPGLPPKIS